MDAKLPAETASDLARRRQRTRNIAIAIGLVCCVALFYLITIFKMGGAVLQRAL